MSSSTLPEARDVVRKSWDLFKNTWLGEVAVKNPCDAWEYQEIIYQLRPDVILETGSFKGGGALFLASLCDLIDHGHVISLDVREYNDKRQHPRIEWIMANSVQPGIVQDLHARLRGQKVLLILDADHDAPHVLKELENYCDLIQPGSYIIVEDTWWTGNGNGGPGDSVRIFLKEHPEFEIDKTRDKFGVSNNPDGFLRRKA